jgi:hypothetical protein
MHSRFSKFIRRGRAPRQQQHPYTISFSNIATLAVLAGARKTNCVLQYFGAWLLVRLHNCQTDEVNDCSRIAKYR